MSEEMRKEFEEFWVNYCEKRGVNCNLARLINGEYASWPEHNAYVGWQASREAMRLTELRSKYANQYDNESTHLNSGSDLYKKALLKYYKDEE